MGFLPNSVKHTIFTPPTSFLTEGSLIVRLLLLFWLLPLWAMAQSPAPNEPEAKGFLIEAIDIQGSKTHNTSLLRSALQLETGQVYSELDLRLGVYRLESLRFVLQAQMRLLRGSTRGAYRLSITITEGKRLFYVLLSEAAYTENDYFENEELETPRDPEQGVGLTGFTLGKRWFPGKNGEINFFFPFHPGLSYTHYNLFNRNVVASVALQIPGGFGKNFSAYPEAGRLTQVDDKYGFGASFSIGMLLTKAQRLNFNYKLNQGEIKSTTPLGLGSRNHHYTTFRNHKAELVWSYDTKDHPLFPTSGDFIITGLQLDREFRNAAESDEEVPYNWLEANSYFSYVSAQRYWNFRQEQTIGLKLLARFGKTNLDTTQAETSFDPPTDYNSNKFSIEALHARNFLKVNFLGKPRDFRFEAELTWEHNNTSLPNSYYPPPEFNRYKARLGITARDHWGFIRISAVYRNVNEELWQ